MDIFSWLNSHGQPAIRLYDGRIGLVISGRILPISANTTMFDPFSSERALQLARCQVKEAMSLSMALETTTPKTPVTGLEELPAAPFVTETVHEMDPAHEEPLFDLLHAKPPVKVIDFDLPAWAD